MRIKRNAGRDPLDQDRVRLRKKAKLKAPQCTDDSDALQTIRVTVVAAAHDNLLHLLVIKR